MSSIRLEVGKRYLRRDGFISGLIGYRGTDVFYDTSSNETYDETGSWRFDGYPSDHDLIAELKDDVVELSPVNDPKQTSEETADPIPVSLDYICKLIKEYEKQEVSASGIKIKLIIE